ncbi:hypothetical protein N0V84_009538 [Fusarium piperis]|uniref:Uncharacterized protein n=1 Tax=Fusarium piperis TaxID=1435070 RepID=A0A9W8W648_9HYPO|nr:hypothetical protein N0V84_009538 [Fusarium piperis]
MAPLVWLVTGCSSGFGRIFAQQILNRGDAVIATARKVETLDDLSKAGASVMKLDVTDDQDTITGIVKSAMSIHGRIDVLVNNAAFVLGGAWEDLSQFRQAFETNVFGVLKVTKALLPHFRERRTGTNVFISSISGFHGYEFNGGYSGTKFALEGMAESLWRETTHFGIRTLIVEPGQFRTELLTSRNLKNEPSKIADYAQRSKDFNEYLANRSGHQAGDPEKGVAIVLDLVRGEGVAEGKEMPLRIALGVDGYEVVKEKCDNTLKDLEEWKHVSCSTNFE